MAKPLVAIIGRPNVGKSTFFNKVSNTRTSISLDTPGVTRDRIYADAEWCGYNFTMIDTGGLDIKSDDKMLVHIRRQAEIAIDLCEVIVFIVDGKEGITPVDLEVAEMLRNAKKPIVLGVNKIDNNNLENFYDFYSLGLGDPVAISCEHGKGLGDLLDEVVKYFPNREETQEEDKAIRIAVVGKPNSGKSSLVNKILGYDRTIVSDVAGTTRDAIDEKFTRDGQDYVIIDTAGMRKKGNIEDDSIERYSVIRSLAAVKRADVVLIVLDVSSPVSEQDVKIAGFVHEQGKPSIIVMNKWDLIEKDTNTINEYNKKLDVALSFMDYKKTIFVSALTGQRIEKVLSLVNEVYQKSSFKVTTGILNDTLSHITQTVEPPIHKGRKLKIFYATQAATNPPTFIIFVNDSDLMHFSYKRYLENQLRSTFNLDGTPIRLFIRNRDEKDQ